MKKETLALGGLALATLVLGGWLATAFLGRGVDPVASAGSAANHGPAPGAGVELESGARSAQPGATVARTTAGPAVLAPEVAVDPWAKELGGLVGRIVEEDGSPVADISVALVQVDANLVLSADWDALGEKPPELVIGETLSDADGRFRLDGGYDSSFHGLGVDLRGPRSTVRVVDSQLHHGEVTDFGDIVLTAGCTVFGSVVGAAGAPVAGARVRFVPAPPDGAEMIMQVGVQDFRPDCAVAISSVIESGLGSPVIEAPPLIRKHLDDLPMPTVYTDARGEYRLEHAPIGKLLQAVDKPGLLGLIRVITTTAGEVPLDTALLGPGQTVEGLVFDDQDEPLVGIEVLAGIELPMGEVAILQPAGRTDADGRFAVSGLPVGGTAIACARRSPDEPWVGVSAGSAEELEVELESVLRVTVHVTDLAGEPLSGAAIELAPAFEPNLPMGFLGLFMRLGATPLEQRFVETEPGSYVCEKVTPGRYQVLARPKGLAAVNANTVFAIGATELTLKCAAGQKVEITVLDAGSGEPVAGARASLVAMSAMNFMRALAVGRTGQDGRVSLGPYAPLDEDEGGMFAWQMGRMPKQQVLVQHPRYADETIELIEGSLVAEVRLQRGGELLGRIVWGADPPQEVYMLTLENREGVEGLREVFQPPRFGHSDLAGAFRFTNVPPGEYRVEVLERFLGEDPLTLMMAQKEPTTVHREEEVMIASGERVEILIDLSPTGQGQTARLAGSVTVNGRPVAGAKVNVSSRGAGGQATTDARGEFETTGFLTGDEGQAQVRIRGDVETLSGVMENTHIYGGSIEVEPQRVQRLDLDLQTTSVRVRVVDQRKAAVPGAKVNLRPENSWGAGSNATTNSTGEAELAIVEEGKCRLTVSATGYSKQSVTVDLDAADREDPVEVELRGAVLCSGICDLSTLNYATLNRAFLHISGEGRDEWTNLDEDDLRDDGLVAFEVDGLQEGEYKAKFWAQGQMSAEVTFYLPAGGDTGLRIVYVPGSNDNDD